MVCDKLDRWEVGEEVQDGGAHVHLGLIGVDVWQGATQIYKAIVLQ